MENTNIDKRFALIADNNDVLYPYKKKQKESGRFGFALTAPGEQDRHGNGYYTLDISEVVRRLVFDNWSARVRTDSSVNKREGSLGIGKRSIKGYWISDELKHLVVDAKVLSLQINKESEAKSSSKNNIQQNLSNDENPINKNSDNLKKIITELEESAEALSLQYSDLLGEDINVIAKRRIGQGPFRRLLEAQHGSKCFLSGVSKRELLIASHIVPWSIASQKDRVNKDNGLLLSVSWDSVFDKGLVTFGESGNVIFSSELDEHTAKNIGINKDAFIPQNLLNENRRNFLKYHREHIYKNSK